MQIAIYAPRWSSAFRRHFPAKAGTPTGTGGWREETPAGLAELPYFPLT
jgi:hypothetical protein